MKPDPSSQRCSQCGGTDHQLCNTGATMTDDYVDMTDENGHQFTLTGRYRMACWRIDELVKQGDALARQVNVMQQAVTLANEERFKAENLAAEMAGLVREARKQALDELLTEFDRMFDPTFSYSAWLHAEADRIVARTAPKEAT